MSKVYLPSFTSSDCVVILDNNTIRLYDGLPTQGNSINYTDYYINSHYLSKSGVELIDIVPACEDQDNLTSDFYYRNDFADICIIFLTFTIFVVIIPYKIFSRVFGRWLKL